VLTELANRSVVHRERSDITVVDSTMIDPGLTCDEAMALFGWTIWLAAMTGGAWAVGFHPGARVRSYPSPTPSPIPEPTGSLQRAPFQREKLDPGAEVTHKIGTGREASLYVIEGGVRLDDHDLDTGDAAKITHQDELTISARDRNELILVNVTMKFEPVGAWRNYL